MTTRGALAGIDAAALHMARTYGKDTDGDPDPATLRRWAGRIRLWAYRYPDEITDHGREGRRRLYDLVELQRVADRVLRDTSASVL